VASYPQYQQYPPPPPPPPPPKGSNKAVLIVFSVVVVLVVIGSGIFVVSRFAGGSDDSAGSSSTQPSSRVTNDASNQPTKAPTNGAGTPSSQPKKPAASPSVPADCNGCFPGLTVNGMVKQLGKRGFVCKEDRITGMQCEKGNLEVGLDRNYRHKNYIDNIDVTGRASAKGDYPRGGRDAYTRLNAGLPGVLPLFIADAAVRQQIVTFTAKNSAHADQGASTARDAKIGGFRLSCHGVGGVVIRGNGRSAASYSTSVHIYGPSTY
jgi:hypothetical protein